MCGILLYYKSSGITREELSSNLGSLKLIRHRGPDGEGVALVNTRSAEVSLLKTDETPEGVKATVSALEYADRSSDLFIGHRRLSIIDTSINGHQPMCYKGRYWITFNGEIYNYVEIKQELEKHGYKFTTHSDTEVILAAYDKWRGLAVVKFNGMFSFLIYDAVERKLFVANDRYGVKPLYYYSDDNTLLFFSELKQLRNFNIDLPVNFSVLKEFVSNYYLDYDETTVFTNIKRFRPSHYATIDLANSSRSINYEAYYELSFRRRKITEENAKEEFNYLFNDAIKLRLRSDVPVGCSISGGLDSSSILIRAVQQLAASGSTKALTTFSVVFPGLPGDESEYIRKAISNLNVDPEFVNPLEHFSMHDFEKHIYHQDFPVQSTSNYSEWCLAERVRQKNITVLLNGQGGDEILAGYHHHFYRYCRQLILSGKIIFYLKSVKQYAELKNVPVNSIHKLVLNEVKLAIKLKTGLAKISDSLVNKWSNANTLVATLKLDLTQFMLPTYLRSDDRDFMAFSVETRHPFLDYRLVDFCNSLPDELKIHQGWQKWLLRSAMDDLPHDIRFRRDKKGYTTPESDWIKKFKSDFNYYLTYVPGNLSVYAPDNAFSKYSLGAWYKVAQDKHFQLAAEKKGM